MAKSFSFLDALVSAGRIATSTDRLRQKYLQNVDDRGWTRIFDWTPGAYQTHDPYNPEESVLAYPYVFACITLIQSDIGKLRPTAEQFIDGIWEEVPDDAITIIRRPNNYQNHITFKEHWVNSKLDHGNTYTLKIRDPRGNIEGLHILDPLKVTPLIAENGDVFYRLGVDNLVPLDEAQLATGDLESGIVVPASEIIHDRFNCLYHPLVGLSPIFACGSSATMGLEIIKNSKNFFKNGTNPGGVLLAPGAIADETATRLKDYWQANFAGKKSGNIAVLGDNLKYEPMRMTNVDAQLIEHSKWTAATVCSCFHVPGFKVGVGQSPNYSNIETLNIVYYTDCLQAHIEAMEELLAYCFGFKPDRRIQLDLTGLFRMDQSTLIKNLKEISNTGYMAPDEGRRKLNLRPVPGGKFPYLQQQNFSLEALAKRDAGDPLSVNPDPPPATPAEPDTNQQQFWTGAQAKTLQRIISAVATGELSAERASTMISAAFPLMLRADIDDILAPYIDMTTDMTQEASELNRKTGAELLAYKVQQLYDARY